MELKWYDKLLLKLKILKSEEHENISTSKEDFERLGGFEMFDLVWHYDISKYKKEMKSHTKYILFGKEYKIIDKDPIIYYEYLADAYIKAVTIDGKKVYIGNKSIVALQKLDVLPIEYNLEDKIEIEKITYDFSKVKKFYSIVTCEDEKYEEIALSCLIVKLKNAMTRKRQNIMNDIKILKD